MGVPLCVGFPFGLNNLIAEKAMPVTILVLLNPGVNDDGNSNRSVEYDTLERSLRDVPGEGDPPRGREEVPPARRPRRPRHRRGLSSGGICAFTAAWERPDLFGKVLTHDRQLHEHPRRRTSTPASSARPPKKPIRVFLSGRHQRPDQPARRLVAGQRGDVRGPQGEGLRRLLPEGPGLPRLLDLRPAAPRGPSPDLGRRQALSSRGSRSRENDVTRIAAGHGDGGVDGTRARAGPSRPGHLHRSHFSSIL